MSVAARYLNRELAAVFAVVLVVLLVMSLGGRFIGYLQDAAAGKFNAGNLVVLIGLRLPEFAQLLLPISLFLAVVLTLSRSYAEQEMTVLLSGGLGVQRLVLWLLPGILVIAALVAWCALDLAPRGQRASYELLQAERADRDIANLRPGVFHVYSKGDRVSYADGLDDVSRELEGVFLSERTSDRAAIVVRAEEGRQYVDSQTGSRFLLLTRGTRYEGEIGKGSYRVVGFERMGQRIEVAARQSAELRATQQPTAALLADTAPAARAELGYRLSLPLLTLNAGLLAIALAPVRPRQGRFARLPVALFVFLSYYLLLVLQKDLTASERVPATFSYWPLHAGFFGLALYGLARIGRPRRG
ncbi:MAG: LPS export ABC transporter permease LptF [Pseudomonadota bacterium]